MDTRLASHDLLFLGARLTTCLWLPVISIISLLEKVYPTYILLWCRVLPCIMTSLYNLGGKRKCIMMVLNCIILWTTVFCLVKVMKVMQLMQVQIIFTWHRKNINPKSPLRHHEGAIPGHSLNYSHDSLFIAPDVFVIINIWGIYGHIFPISPLCLQLNPRGVAFPTNLQHYGRPKEEEKGSPYGEKWFRKIIHALNYLQ